MSFLHGINVTEIKTTSRSIVTVATAVIGLIATAPAAVAGAFPLDTAVKVTNLDDAIEKAGAEGTLRAALMAIAGQVTAPIVVVRVAPGATPADTITAVIGTDEAGVKTGMQALLTAPAQLNLHPRIIGAPGLEAELVTKGLVNVAKRLRARRAPQPSTSVSSGDVTTALSMSSKSSSSLQFYYAAAAISD